MWSVFALAAVLALLQPKEPPAVKSGSLPQSECSSPIAQHVVARFPGAKLLTKQDFASNVVGHSFRYRDVSNDMIVIRPGEFFGPKGMYSYGHRAITGGAYSFDCGLVSLDTPDRTFFALGKKRVFFWREGKLFTTGTSERGTVFELIRNP